MGRNHWLFVLGAALGIARPTCAQTLIRTHEGPATGGAFGTSIAALQDLDGDGVRDYAISDPGNGFHAGTVDVYSGATGANLFTIHGSDSGTFGSALSDAGDVDGDGIADLLVGDPDFTDPDRFYHEGSVRVCSGADGSTIREFIGPWPLCQLGGSVAGLDDVDGDGIPDLLVCAHPVSDPTAPLHLFGASGRDGSMLYEIDPDDSYRIFIAKGSGVGVDRDGDGLRDLFMIGGDQSRIVRTCSGATGATISEVDLDACDLAQGVSETGDIDGDGEPELLVWCEHPCPGGPSAAIDVISIATGVILRVERGSGVVTLPDLDGDGVGELLLTREEPYPNYFALKSGRSGHRMDAFLGDIEGTETATVGDVDGDGLSDFCVRDPWFVDPQTHLQCGSVQVRSNDEFWFEAAPNPAAPLDVETLATGCVPAGNPIGIVLVDLGGSPMFQFIALTTADAGGRLNLSTTVPPGLTGSSATFQSFGIDRNGRTVATPAWTIDFN
jgi:hypothetical protein